MTNDLPRTPVPRTNTRSANRGFLMPSDVETTIELLGPREVVDQAIDVLMARDDVSRDDAFELLVQGSSDSHCRVLVFAAEIVQQRKGE